MKRVSTPLAILVAGAVGASLFLSASVPPQTSRASTTHRVAARPHLCLTPVQKEILSHLSLVDVPDGRGGLNKTLRITGVNVQIVNGLGATNGNPANPNALQGSAIATNGLGNLIVGYDEAVQLSTEKTGSHNLVVGPYHHYESFGGLVVGRYNRLEAPVSAIVGGSLNYVRGISSTVIGGGTNGALEDLSVAVGGLANEVTGYSGVTLGGQNNLASGVSSTVTGGLSNEASGDFSVVSGGSSRLAPSDFDWVAGSLFQDQ